MRLWRRCAVLLTTLIGATGCRDQLVNYFSFYPQRIDPETRIDVSGAEEIFLHSADGVRLHSLYFANASTDKALLYLHGNAGHAYHRVEDARTLRDAGAAVLLLEYRGYGKSDGKPSEAGIYKDAEAGLQFLREEKSFALQNIIVLGRSIGSAAAVHLARQQPDLGGLILVTPLASGRAMAQALGLAWLLPEHSPHFNNLSKADSITIPALVIHGDRDRTVPFQQGQQVFQQLGSENKTFVKIPGADHNDITAVGGSAYWQPIAHFIDQR